MLGYIQHIIVIVLKTNHMCAINNMSVTKTMTVLTIMVIVLSVLVAITINNLNQEKKETIHHCQCCINN